MRPRRRRADRPRGADGPRAGRQSDAPFAEPWPRDAWPPVPTRVLACRHDRLFPLELVRRLARERLGVEADVIDGGHLPALGRPRELARRLDAYRRDGAGVSRR